MVRSPSPRTLLVVRLYSEGVRFAPLLLFAMRRIVREIKVCGRLQPLRFPYTRFFPAGLSVQDAAPNTMHSRVEMFGRQ
jgi:hypothetical protein